MNTNQKETQLLYLQVYASIILIISTIISTILTNNNIKKHENKQTIFSPKPESKVTITNRVILTILVIIFTYINYKFYEINKDTKKSNIQKNEFIASILTLIAGFILLYTTIKSEKENNQNTNPNTPIL